METLKEKAEKLPASPGVYIFRDHQGEILYIGKAANLRRRVKSYFRSKSLKNTRITERAQEIDHEELETVIEALVREAELIKRYRPPYNVKENDDRSFLHVIITDDEYPRVLLVRGKDLDNYSKRSVFGPFVYSSQIREALKIIRRIFPYSTHSAKEVNKGRSCFYHQIDLCPGVCAGKIKKKEYLNNIKNIELFFKGKKKEVLSRLEKEMKEVSKNMEFEKAQDLKRRVDALHHIQDAALLGEEKEAGNDNSFRVEGYDISNISGDLAAGSLVVFKGGIPSKKDYRSFKIKNVSGPDDANMIKEIVERRLNNDWPLPDLMVIDGGAGQVNAAKKALKEKGKRIPVVGIAKGEDRKGEKMVGDEIKGMERKLLIDVRDEAHRFALKYHKKLRKRDFL